MDPAGAAANVNKALAENPCQQHGDNLSVSEACRQYTDSYNHGRAFGNSSSTQPVIDRSVTVQLEFQDSQLSPALNLLPCLEKSHPYSDSTLFHHTDAEFAPLRGFPDLSVMSERCPLMSHVGAAEDSHLQDTLHDQAALSQHPLAVPAAPSEGEISCCSLSQHSLSPGDHSKSIKNQESVSCGAESKIDRHMEGEEQSTAQRRSQEDSKQLLGDGVSTRSLVELSEVDAVVAVSSSNAVSSTSETVFSQFDPTSNQPNTAKNQLEPSVNVPTEFIPQHSISSFKPFPGTAIEGELSSSREQPQGGSLSSSFQKTSGSAVGSDISNITVRNPQAYPRQTTDRLREQLLFEGQRRSNSAPQSRQHSGNRGSHSGLCFTPASGGGTLVSGLQRVLWSSGNLTTTDGSFLSSQPVSQSTPAVPFLRPPLTLTKLPFIHSEQETVTSSAASSQNIHSRTGLMPALDLSTVDQRFSPIYSQNRVTEFPSGPSIGFGTAHAMPHVHSISEKQDPPPVLSPPASDKPASTGTMMKDQVSHLALSRVQSLPSLSYLQKVDAWKANQSSSRSFYDNLALQGFDGVSPKKKAEDTVSEALSRMLSQQSLSKGMSKAPGANGSSQINQPPLSSSHSGSGSPRRVDVVGADVCRGQASESPVTHSHSSLNSVVTSIQRDADTHSQQVPGAQADDIIPPTRSLDTLSSLLSNGKNQGVSSSAASMEKNPVNQSPFFSLGRFSDISSSFNMSSTLSSSQGSCRGEQSMRASVGAASSVVSLEVDNYAPYWNSRPASPPHTRELNIEDRIPLYLQNLGIDQSPSTILNPFTPRGPIREPEFSPTDLCTIKGSVGTPTKSTQPSEVDSSPQKEAFSGSSHVSADSSASVTHRLSEHEQDRPASQRSVTFSQTDTPPRFHSTLHPSSDLQQSHASQLERSFGLPAQLSQESDPPLGPRDEVKGDEDSFVGSGTLHEIRRLLGQAESLVSGRSSLTSSPGSHRLSESDTSLVSLSQNSRSYRDDTSLSVGGNFSLLLTRSSSDSALKDSLSSSRGPQQLSTQTERRTTDPAALSQSREESLKSRDLCVTPRRAEPEGCSAADPDKAKPLTTLPVMQMNVNSLAGSLIPQSQQNSENDVIGSSESSPSHISAEVGSQSDSSSESSLAARVAKLLQSESPVSMVTSRPSTADPEDSRAREWILMKVSGRRCESLELNPEDRARIEDIKRELLLNTRQIKWSSDSEGSVQSSVGSGSQPVKTFIGVRNMESRASEPLQKANPLDSSVSPHVAIQQNLEARVHQIALREGLSPPPLTSITIATTRRTPSPQLTSHGLITGTLNSSNIGSEHLALEKGSHGRVSDSHFEAVYPEQRHEPATIQNISDREEEMEGEGEQRENKKIEEMADDNTENIMKNDLQTDQRTAHMDYFAANSNQILSSSNKSHLSQIHVTLSPKPCQVITQRPQSSPSEITISPKQSDSVKYHSTRLSDQNTFKDVLPQRHSHTMSSTADEHLVTSTSNQVNLYKNREQVQSQNADTVGSRLQASFRYPQSFTSSQRLIGTSRAISIQSGAAPTLLPYKPHGSSELFYVPQADAELSPDRSDTTIESSHPGSDDAVPPRFSTDILGSRELEDNIVTPKHKEGIYSKKANMKRGAWRFDSTAPEGSDVSEKDLEAVYMNEQYENEEENFVPLHMEADYSTDDFHLHSNTMQESKLPQEPRHLPSKPIRKAERTNQKTKDRRPHDVSVEISSSLDQLWCRFSERWSMEEARPTNEGETSLLERLERLSRLIHSTTPAHKPVKQPESRRRDYDRRSDQVEAMRGGEERNSIEVPQQAWAEHEEEQENLHRCPAERDESSSVSVETSSSLSTIDTERLLRAFGPQRVTSKGLKNSDSLLRLYNNINKQKTGSRKPSSKHAAVSTDDSTVSPDSLSASSILSLPSQRGVSQSFTTKRPKVKLVSKGVQAGDLEIVINGTRKHTRDVGTIFPSPGVSRNARPAKAFSKSVQDVTSILTVSTANPTHTITALKRDTRTQYQNGVSWFVSADELKSDGRKENQPESESRPCTSQAWFEPHSRTQPWREPTREPVREPLRERQIQVEQERPTEPKTAIETENSKPLSLVRISLQEALALHRPEFVSRSRERIKRLGLLVEERRLQAVFNREREELFNCPGPSRPLRPAPVPRKRVVPRKEMVERSKHWLGKKSHTQRIDRTNKIRRKYSQLPEVQKRKEEERRRAEYRSYRLNARLFNKKVTNRVLGKRAPWQ